MRLKNRYELLELLGEGGFAVVWKAVDLELNRLVAIKVLKLSHLNENSISEHIQRLKREAKLLAQLAHPNIVSAYSIDLTDDLAPFVVMEFLTGQSLEQALSKRHKLATPLIKLILLQTCAGLSFAHSKGVIHRDLSPSNIFLCGDQKNPTVKIIDFGLSFSSLSPSAQITKTGLLIGNPAYMSPECIAGMKLDAKADIYAFGCVAYHMLTGAPAFQAESVMGVLYNHQNNYPPEPSAPGLGEQEFFENIKAVILRCIQKNKKLRFESCVEIAEAIQQQQTEAEIFQKAAKHGRETWLTVEAKPTLKHLDALHWVKLVAIISTFILVVIIISFQSKHQSSRKPALNRAERVEQGDHYLRIGNLGLAEAYYTKALKEKEDAIILLKLAKLKIDQKQPQEARDFGQRFLQIAKVSSSETMPPEQIETLLSLAAIESSKLKGIENLRGYSEAAVRYSEKSSSIQSELRAKSLFQLALCYCDLHNASQAMKLLERALSSAELTSNSSLINRIRSALADVQLKLGLFEKARGSYLEVFRKSSRQTNEYCDSLVRLSTILELEGKKSEALKYKSLIDSWIARNGLRYYMTCVWHTGLIFSENGSGEIAERLYKDSLTLSKRQDEDLYSWQIGQAALQCLAQLYVWRAQHGDVRYWQKAEIISKEALSREKLKGLRTWRGDTSIEILETIYKQEHNVSAESELRNFKIQRQKMQTTDEF
ncbi:MAG: protein kinase [Candidatus Obscuribacterales bacterium]|nr:protein kinase [Candidatus Obscuribacterales bacterium]